MNMNIYEIKEKYHNYDVFLVLDSAQCSDCVVNILHRIKSTQYNEIYSLFSQTKENNLPWEVAPLLLNISYLDDDEILYILNELWCENSVIQIFGVNKNLPLKILLKKLKKLLQLKMPDGNIIHFRWYDPRIMKNIGFLLNDDDFLDFFKNVYFWILKDTDFKSGYKIDYNLVVKNV